MSTLDDAQYQLLVTHLVDNWTDLVKKTIGKQLPDIGKDLGFRVTYTDVRAAIDDTGDVWPIDIINPDQIHRDAVMAVAITKLYRLLEQPVPTDFMHMSYELADQLEKMDDERKL